MKLKINQQVLNVPGLVFVYRHYPSTTMNAITSDFEVFPSTVERN